MSRAVFWILSIAFVVFISIWSFFGGNFHYKKFRLENGQLVECKLKYVNAGKVFLNFCKDGNRYLAQKDVTQLPS